MVSVFFFFFQAEDGIRDLTVTGVQTCALPILPARGAQRAEAQEGRDASAAGTGGEPRHPEGTGRPPPAGAGPHRVRRRDRESVRVGKECRSRWSPYH